MRNREENDEQERQKHEEAAAEDGEKDRHQEMGAETEQGRHR